MSFSCFAQDDSSIHVTVHRGNTFYLRGGVGYASSYTGDMVNGTSNAFNVKSYTSGLNGVLGCGYMFNDHIGLELDGSMVAPGRKYTLTSYSIDSTGRMYTDDITKRTLRSLLLVMPGVVLQTGCDRFNIYSRLSLVFPVIDKSVSEDDFVNYAGSNSLQYAIKMRSTLGFNAAVGISYKLCSHVNLWAEANALALSPYTAQTTITGATLNGVNNIGSFSASQKTTTYVFSGGYTLTRGVLTNYATQPTSTRPYSNFGLQAGISVDIADKHKTPVTISKHDKYFYVKGGLGYAMPFANANENGLYTNGTGYSRFNYVPGSSNYNTITQTFAGKPSSYSSGLSGTIGGGYMLGAHFGLELDALFGIVSRKYKEKDSWNDSDGSTAVYNITTYSQRRLLLTPCIVIQTGGVVNIYSRLGLVLPILSQLREEDYSAHFSDVGTQTIAYKMMFTLGYTGALGLKYQLTHKLQLWGEVSVLSFEPYVRESKFISGSQNGVPTEISGTMKYKFTNNDLGPDPATTTFPYSNAGVQAGVAFRL